MTRPYRIVSAMLTYTMCAVAVLSLMLLRDAGSSTGTIVVLRHVAHGHIEPHCIKTLDPVAFGWITHSRSAKLIAMDARFDIIHSQL